MKQYVDTKAWIDFTQGLDIRLMQDADIGDLNRMKIKMLHFAWDNHRDDLSTDFLYFSEHYTRMKSHNITVYVLVNYDSTLSDDLFRIYRLRDLGFDPFVMVYNKPYSDRIVRDLQRWCNNKRIFKKCKRFEDYIPNRRKGRTE